MLIFDSHAHIIPDLSGPCGYGSVEEHLRISQKAMHEHLVQPARRKKDNKKVIKLQYRLINFLEKLRKILIVPLLESESNIILKSYLKTMY